MEGSCEKKESKKDFYLRFYSYCCAEPCVIVRALIVTYLSIDETW